MLMLVGIALADVHLRSRPAVFGHMPHGLEPNLDQKDLSVVFTSRRIAGGRVLLCQVLPQILDH